MHWKRRHLYLIGRFSSGRILWASGWRCTQTHTLTQTYRHVIESRRNIFSPNPRHIITTRTNTRSSTHSLGGQLSLLRPNVLDPQSCDSRLIHRLHLSAPTVSSQERPSSRFQRGRSNQKPLLGGGKAVGSATKSPSITKLVDRRTNVEGGKKLCLLGKYLLRWGKHRNSE